MISFALVLSCMYCRVFIFVLSPFYIFDLYELGGDLWISNESFTQTKHLCVLIHIRIKGKLGAVKLV